MNFRQTFEAGVQKGKAHHIHHIMKVATRDRSLKLHHYGSASHPRDLFMVLSIKGWLMRSGLHSRKFLACLSSLRPYSKTSCLHGTIQL